MFSKAMLCGPRSSQDHEMLTGKQIALMIVKDLTVGDTEEQTMELSDLISLELKQDNLRGFDMAWDEMLLGMDELPKDRTLESLYRKQLSKSTQFQNALALYEQASEGTPEATKG